MESVTEENPVNVCVDSEVKRDKVSTGVGGTPPRDVESEINTSEVITEQIKPVRKISTTTGTSPPPQNISTQVQYQKNTINHS